MNQPPPDGPLAVVKFGGEVVARSDQLLGVAGDVAHLSEAGWRFLICHGGNPQANSLTERLHLERKQVGGRRITDAATLQVMKQVLAGQCNVDVVAAAAARGLAPWESRALAPGPSRLFGGLPGCSVAVARIPWILDSSARLRRFVRP